MKRLFFALWPDALTRQKLDAINARIELKGVRKLKPSNLHITLVFLGNIEDRMLADIAEQAGHIQVPNFTFQLDGIEHWREPKTICLTVNQPPQALHKLVGSLVDIVKQYPIHLHERLYRAHVTLMRKAKADYSLAFEPVLWKAKGFVLVESISTPNGIVYEVLERWPLNQ